MLNCYQACGTGLKLLRTRIVSFFQLYDSNLCVSRSFEEMKLELAIRHLLWPAMVDLGDIEDELLMA